MSASKSSAPELGNTGYELFIGALSVLSLVNILLLLVIRDASLSTVIYALDALLSVIFLADFAARMKRAPSRTGYFFRGFGWADLLASLPFPQLKVLRLFRLLRVIRLLRAAGGPSILRSVLRDRAGSALLTLLFVGILVLEFGSLAILKAEMGAPGANIETAGDAIWYTVVTISTVGYGDQYPVTLLGRQIGTLIIVVGVGIFGTLTGFLANFFLEPRRERSAGSSDAEQDAVALQLQQAKELLEQQRVAIAALERAIAEGRAG
ncbi:potassium channel family protein [Nocardioides taihuensis]|uniref:Potassium channel family protein n=1 Tax=Nocardioides taihuensis TaxID=1835606 RepID=A0ABW0BIE9_9ACTN